MLPLSDLTVGGLLRQTAARYPERDAVWSPEGVWSYEELERETERAATALVAMGVRPGDRVGVLAEIEPETVAAYYAIQLIGAVAVMLNTSLSPSEVSARLELTESAWFLVGCSHKGAAVDELLSQVPERYPMKGCAVVASAASSLCAPLLDHADPERMDDVRRMESEVSCRQTAVILFTSGSSSLPKAVMSSHHARVNGGRLQADDLRATCEDRFCAALPMFHCFCISVDLMAALAVGGCLCIPADRHTGNILACIRDGRCTVLSSVPAMYKALISRGDLTPEAVSTLRTGIIGGSSYPPELFERIERELGMRLLSSLGQTETTAGLTICDYDAPLEVRSHTIGHFMAHVEGKIADLHTGEALPAGQPGEICVRGYLVMQGYCRCPEAQSAAIDAEGWLHTGDLGTLREDGNITLSGRLKELIIRGGENISPGEIEAALSDLPQLRQYKVVGVPDEHFGEEVCACLSLQEGQTITEEALREHLKARLAYYKVPRYFLFLDELPTTATGKIRLGDTKKLAAERLGLLPTEPAVDVYLDRARRVLTRNRFVIAKGIEPVEAEADRVRMRVELREEFTNGHGIAHGGFLFTVADCTAGVTAHMDGRGYVTSDSHIQYISSIREGMILSEGQILHRGRSLVTVLVRLTAEDGRLLAQGTFNMYCIEQKAE